MPIYQTLIKLSQDFETIAAPLTQQQKRHVDYQYGKNQHHAFSDHAMGGADKHRTEIELNKRDILPPKHIARALRETGHTEFNYGKGVAKDKYDREVKIGKALAKAGKHKELKDFETDKRRAAKADHKIVISRHNHDVANMSTNQGWTSCMDFEKHSNKPDEHHHHLTYDIKHGTHVAYLVHKDDHNLNNPIARIALKPHVSETGHTILRPEDRHYGTANSNFHKTVSAWAKKHFPAKDALYEKHEELYNDGSIFHIKGKAFNRKFIAGKHYYYLAPHVSNKLINKAIQSTHDKQKLNHFVKRHAHQMTKESVHHALKVGLYDEARENLLGQNGGENRDIVVHHHRKESGYDASKEAPPSDKSSSRRKWYNYLTNAEQKHHKENAYAKGSHVFDPTYKG